MGVQGSLLSVFVEPVYFSSIILGSLYHGDHLSRAVYQRIASIEDLPPLYVLNKPLLSGKYLCACHLSLTPVSRCVCRTRTDATGACSVGGFSRTAGAALCEPLRLLQGPFKGSFLTTENHHS